MSRAFLSSTPILITLLACGPALTIFPPTIPVPSRFFAKGESEMPAGIFAFAVAGAGIVSARGADPIWIPMIAG